MAEGRIERELSTRELVQHAVEEARLLAKAEILHAKLELKADLRQGIVAGIALGAGAVLAICGLSILFMAVVFALPLPGWGASLLVGLVLLAVAATAVAIGVRRIPKQPLNRTQKRLLKDMKVTREQFA